MKTNTLRYSVIVPLALGATFLFGGPKPAMAQYDFFPTNTTINYVLPGSDWAGAVVGYANAADWSSHVHRTSPSITIAAGASIPAGGALFVCNHSVVKMSGGTVSTVLAQNNSTVKITGGSSGPAGAYDTATINVHGGKITGNLTGEYGGAVNVYGGHIGNSTDYAEVTAGSAMNIYGGTFAAGYIYVGIATDPATGNPIMGAATLNMYGPSLTIASTLSISGGYEYTLKGSLNDGTNVTGLKVVVLTGSVFNLLP